MLCKYLTQIFVEFVLIIKRDIMLRNRSEIEDKVIELRNSRLIGLVWGGFMYNKLSPKWSGGYFKLRKSKVLQLPTIRLYWNERKIIYSKPFEAIGVYSVNLFIFSLRIFSFDENLWVNLWNSFNQTEMNIVNSILHIKLYIKQSQSRFFGIEISAIALLSWSLLTLLYGYG